MRTQAYSWVALVLLVFAGCRNLEFVAPDGGVGKPPTVVFRSPAAGQEVPVTFVVDVSVKDVKGVVDLVVRCGEVELLSRDFQADGGLESDVGVVASVTTAKCRELSSGPGLHDVRLVATATNTQGTKGLDERLVSVNTSRGSMSLQGTPARLRVGESLGFRVASQEPLREAPTADMEGAHVLGVEVGDGGTLYDIRFPSLPPLGTDDGGTSAEAVEEMERPVTVQVSASDPRGNPLVERFTFTLTRILWDRPIPGVFADPSTSVEAPVATQAGLVLPVSVSQTQGVGTWFPLLMRAQDGAAEVQGLAGLESGGWTAVALDRNGRALAHRSDGGFAGGELAFAGTSADAGMTPVTGFTDSPNGLASAWLRLGDLVCRERIRPDPFQPCFIPPTHVLECAGSSGSRWLSAEVSKDGGTRDLSDRPAERNAGSGEAFFGVGVHPSNFCCAAGSCPPPMLLVGDVAQGKLEVRDSFVDAGYLPEQLAPVGDGTFVFKYQDLTTFEHAVALVWDGQPRYRYFPHDPSLFAGVIGVTAMRELVRLDHADPTQTRIERWEVDAGAPTAVPAALVGVWTPDRDVKAALGGIGHNVVTAAPPSKGMAFLLQQSGMAGTHFVLVAFDGLGRLRWIYRYPRLTRNPLLVGSASTQLYLIDPFNSRVVALPSPWN